MFFFMQASHSSLQVILACARGCLQNIVTGLFLSVTFLASVLTVVFVTLFSPLLHVDIYFIGLFLQILVSAHSFTLFLQFVFSPPCGYMLPAAGTSILTSVRHFPNTETSLHWHSTSVAWTHRLPLLPPAASFLSVLYTPQSCPTFSQQWRRSQHFVLYVVYKLLGETTFTPPCCTRSPC